MTDLHFANFIAAIRKGEKLNAPVSVGNVAVTMLQLSNVSWEVNRTLALDTPTERSSTTGRHEVCGAANTSTAGRRIFNRREDRTLQLGSPRTFAVTQLRSSTYEAIHSHAAVSFNPARSSRRPAHTCVIPSLRDPSQATGKPSPVHLGLASYTFRNFTRAQMIGFMKQLNVTALNPKDVKDHLPMDPARRSQGARRLRRRGHLSARSRSYLFSQGRRRRYPQQV
jgi:hypothetical protein